MVEPPAEIESILELIDEAERVDGFSALNEAASLRLRHRAAGSEGLVRRHDGRLVGYGQRDTAADPAGPAEASLVVHPDHRRRGFGTALLNDLLRLGPLEIWAVHDTAAAAALARRTGLLPNRELLIMSRSLAEPVEPLPPPAGVEIRPFRPGVDEDAWIRVNALAFAHHPEQGGLQRGDLEERMSEPWFDPAGFLLATRDDQLLGFHWTKQHPDSLGEVYVLGVAPPDAAPGSPEPVRGLGRSLLAAGLQHLRSVGNTAVLLYVDGTNTRAVELYERARFAVTSRDVRYASPELPPD